MFYGNGVTNYRPPFSWQGDSLLVSSLSGGVLLSLGDFTDDARVACQCGVGLVERVCMGRHELPLVVRAKNKYSKTRPLRNRTRQTKRALRTQAYSITYLKSFCSGS